ncbi:hypothetical protein CPB84DRAFT_1783700 [Gymnopilus junonius]|uniref:Uncharacterized protein n=1 Tax=Gymnopilus junonius TaxID=109634 RepID=A0A9P5TM46_GYMJU|nr:hypothetical protein CPB84DRAFT_1783700 [Gymnopilus junonius]
MHSTLKPHAFVYQAATHRPHSRVSLDRVSKVVVVSVDQTDEFPHKPELCTTHPRHPTQSTLQVRRFYQSRDFLGTTGLNGLSIATRGVVAGLILPGFSAYNGIKHDSATPFTPPPPPPPPLRSSSARTPEVRRMLGSRFQCIPHKALQVRFRTLNRRHGVRLPLDAQS